MDKIFDSVEKMLLHGDYSNVLEKLNEFEQADFTEENDTIDNRPRYLFPGKKSSQSPAPHIKLQILKAIAKSELGDLDESLSIADNAIIEARKNPHLPSLLSALELKAGLLCDHSNNVQSLEVLDEASTLIAEPSETDCIHYYLAKFQFLRGKNHRMLGHQDQALELLIPALDSFHAIGHELMIANTKHIMAKAYTYQGKLDVALRMFEDTLKDYEKLEYNKQIADSLNAIGGINAYKGNLDIALDYSIRSLRVREKIKQEKGVAMSLGNIGELYKEMNKIEEAIDAFDQSLTLCIKLKHNLYTADFVLQLAELCIRIGMIEKANKNLQMAKDFIVEGENRNVDQKIKLAEALLLKFSKRTRDRGQAEILLNEIIAGDQFDQFTTLKAIVHLCELLFEDLHNTGDASILGELDELAIKLENMAKNQNSIAVLTETYIVQMKLRVINGDIKQAKDYLLLAEAIAEENNLGKLQMRISNEFDFLLQKEKELENALSVQDLVEMTNIGETISAMTGIHPEKIIEIENETQVMLSIMHIQGSTVFSKSFNSLLSEKINPNLFGSFLSALNSFGGELFDGSLERARLGEYNLILKPINEHFMLCYVFIGPSYHASRKVNQMVRDFSENRDITLFNDSSDIISINSDDRSIIDEMVESTFLAS